MCPRVGPHTPSFGRQLWGLPSRVEYPSPQGVLLPLVYGTTASPLWLELRGRSAWQATPSWTVYRLACHRLLPWLRVTFAMVPDAAWPGSDQQPWSTAPATGPVGRLGRPSVSDPWGVGSFLSPGRPTCVPCPGPPGSCSPVCPLGVLFCVCGVLGLLAPVHRCARSVCCVACAVSWASWRLFTGVLARCVVLGVRCPAPPGSCSQVCPLGVLCCVCGVLGLLAPVHRCPRSVCCVACAVSCSLVRVQIQANSELILFICLRMVNITFLVLTRPAVCARALLVILLACACSMFFNAGRSFEISSQRELIVLVPSFYGNENQSEARATPVNDRRPGVKDPAKPWCCASAHEGLRPWVHHCPWEETGVR